MYRYWWIYSIFLISAIGCGIPIPKLQESPSNTIGQISPLLPDQKELVFDMSLKVMKKVHSGILVVAKDEKANEYRTVFMAKAGMKLFDFTYKNDSIITNKIFPALDRQIVKNTLQKDLKMLISTPREYETLSNNNGETVLQSRTDEKFLYYYLNDKKRVIKIDKGSENKSHVRVDAIYKGADLDFIFIQHKRLPLLLKLTKIR